MQQYKFQTKVISWCDSKGNEHTNKIILQNQNGPCFVISLINNIILSQELKDSKEWHVVGSSTRNNSSSRQNNSAGQNVNLSVDLGDSLPPVVKTTDIQNLNALLARSENVSLNALLDELTNILFAVNERCSVTLGGPVIDMKAVLDTLPSIETGLNINLQLDKPVINDFAEYTPIVNELLNIFDIKILHGFIADSDELSKSEKSMHFDKIQETMVEALELHPELNDYTEIQEYNNKNEGNNIDVVKQYFRLKRFLEKNKTQLTKKGINTLKTDDSILNDNQFGIFFRNDHFSTIYKAGRNIYLLVNDEGFKDEPNIIWQVLASISGGKDEFLTGNFEKPDPALLEKNAKRRLESPKTVDLTGDELLARQLQQEEDAEISKSLQRKYDDESQQIELKRKRKVKRKRSKGKRNQKRREEDTRIQNKTNVEQGSDKKEAKKSDSEGCVIQ